MAFFFFLSTFPKHALRSNLNHPYVFLCHLPREQGTSAQEGQEPSLGEAGGGCQETQRCGTCGNVSVSTNTSLGNLFHCLASFREEIANLSLSIRVLASMDHTIKELSLLAATHPCLAHTPGISPSVPFSKGI